MSGTETRRTSAAEISVAINDLLDNQTADEAVAVTALCNALAIRCAGNAASAADMLQGLARMHQLICTAALDFYSASAGEP